LLLFFLLQQLVSIEVAFAVVHAFAHNWEKRMQLLLALGSWRSSLHDLRISFLGGCEMISADRDFFDGVGKLCVHAETKEKRQMVVVDHGL
jgi:hypothetical protein